MMIKRVIMTAATLFLTATIIIIYIIIIKTKIPFLYDNKAYVIR